jgi:hypothetical protein
MVLIDNRYTILAMILAGIGTVCVLYGLVGFCSSRPKLPKVDELISEPSTTFSLSTLDLCSPVPILFVYDISQTQTPCDQIAMKCTFTPDKTTKMKQRFCEPWEFDRMAWSCSHLERSQLKKFLRESNFELRANLTTAREMDTHCMPGVFSITASEPVMFTDLAMLGMRYVGYGQKLLGFVFAMICGSCCCCCSIGALIASNPKLLRVADPRTVQFLDAQQAVPEATEEATEVAQVGGATEIGQVA